MVAAAELPVDTSATALVMDLFAVTMTLTITHLLNDQPVTVAVPIVWNTDQGDVETLLLGDLVMSKDWHN